MFDKTRKNLTSTPAQTTLDLTVERFQRIAQEKDEANVQSRNRVAELTKERAGLVKQVEDLAGRLQKLNDEFLKALANIRAEQTKRIAAGSVTEADLAAGRVNITDFMAAGKKDEIINAEAQAQADIELGKIRDVIRSLKALQFQIILQVREKEEIMARVKGQLGENFYQELKAMMATLEMAGVNVPNVEWAHQNTKLAQNDEALAVKGSPLFNVLTVKITSMDEAELLANDPRISSKHFPELRAFIQEISQLDFAEVIMHYTPTEWNGRAGGSIWFDYRQNVVTHG